MWFLKSNDTTVIDLDEYEQFLYCKNNTHNTF